MMQREEPTAFMCFSSVQLRIVDRRSASQMDFFPGKLSYKKAKMAGSQRVVKRLSCEG